MPLVKQTPFFSRVSWCVLLTGLLLLPSFLAIDGICALLHTETPYGIRTARASAVGIGLILSALAPWFSSQPVIVRVLSSLVAALLWFVVFLAIMFGFGLSRS